MYTLQKITIPPAVKTIQARSFPRCTQLTTVLLAEGLEEIGSGVFIECISLQEILIPHTVKAIRD